MQRVGPVLPLRVKADMTGEEVYVIFDKVGSALLCMIDGEYSKYLRDDDCITCRVDKALYGLIESAKLWYTTLKKKLDSYGYSMNPKDQCVYGFIDVSFAVHNDYKSQSGVFITCGLGALYVKSTVPKLNTKSSSEAELVAASDGAGQILWTRDYLIYQGCDLGPAVLYQDNMSAITLIKRGNPASQ